MDKLARLKQKMHASCLMAVIFVGWGAGWRMSTHGEIFWMLMDAFPCYFIILLNRSGKQAIKELENRSAPSGDSPTTAPEPTAAPETPDSTPPEDE